MEKLNNISDSWLVKKYQSGHKNALTLLVKRWHKIFCKQAYWYAKDSDIAKDIAQDSWRVILNKLDTLKDTNKFGGWALAIVTRKSIDYIRKANRTNDFLFEYHQNNVDKEFSTISNDKSLKVMTAINSLPDNQQIVLRLFYIESYSIKEVSKTLNISKGTVKSRLFYAREKLKTILKQRNYE